MFLTTLRLPPFAAAPRLPGLSWLLAAGLGAPLAMEAYNLAALYWADPAWVRGVTLAGPVVIVGGLSILADITWPLMPAFALFVLPWQVVGIEHNWAYRLAFLLLQVLVAAMWWQALRQPSAWLLERWAKRVGLAFACLGVAVCLLVQFAFPETPFWGLMPDYNPRFETGSALAQTTGLPSTVWIMPLAALGIILGLAWFDRHRRRLQFKARIALSP